MSAIKNISLFIPHVYANFNSAAVFDIIQGQGIGEVKNIDFVSKTGSDGKPYNAVYIHFYQWHDNIVARNFQERVLNPSKEARIMYDDPWYWKVSIYTPRETPRETPKISQKSESNTTTKLMPLSSIKYDNDRKANQVENSISYLDGEPFWKRRYYADEDWETMIKNNK